MWLLHEPSPSGFNGLSIPSPFMNDTLNANHFPILIQLPDGGIFVAANQDAMILNWKNNTETRLPRIPNGVRITSVLFSIRSVYLCFLIQMSSAPYAAGAVLLPLSHKNKYSPEVMICGGTNISDSINPLNISAQTPASTQCSRMVLTAAGIAAGWQVETMPVPRIMMDLVLLPDGRVLLVNGAMTGVAGYSDVCNAPSFSVDKNTSIAHLFRSGSLLGRVTPTILPLPQRFMILRQRLVTGFQLLIFQHPI
jgi:hypothetical protein